MREVRDGQRGGRAAVLMQEDDITQCAGVGAGDQRGQDVRTAVQPDGRREEEADFLGEGGESRRGAARGGDEGSWVDDAGEVRVFVVDGEGLGRARLRFVVGV